MTELNKLKERFTYVNDKLEQTTKKLTEINYPSDNQESLFILIKNVNDFNQLFGYDIETPWLDKTIETIKSEIDRYPYRFSAALYNIFRRRTFYYLCHFNTHYCVKHYPVNNKINPLIDYFGEYVKNNSYGAEQIIDRFKNILIDARSFIPLTQFYNTTVDSELFTTLSYFYKLASEEFSSYPDSSVLIEKLFCRILQLIDEYIGNNFLIKKSKLLGCSLQDESNLFWALSTAYKYREKYKHELYWFLEKNNFKKMVKIFARKRDYERKFPDRSHVFTDITPELFTKKRTELYIAYNLAYILDSNKDFEDDFFELISKELNRIILPFINEVNSENNLYFLTLEFMCYEIILKIFNGKPAEFFGKLDLLKKKSRLSNINIDKFNLPEDFIREIIDETAELLYNKITREDNIVFDKVRKAINIISGYKLGNTLKNIIDEMPKSKDKKHNILKLKRSLFKADFDEVYNLFLKLTE